MLKVWQNTDGLKVKKVGRIIKMGVKKSIKRSLSEEEQEQFRFDYQYSGESLYSLAYKYNCTKKALVVYVQEHPEIPKRIPWHAARIQKGKEEEKKNVNAQFLS